MRKFLLAVITLFVFTGCSTLELQTDYDEEFDFTKLSKFSVIYSKKDDGKDFTRSRISKVLTKHFETRGYSSVPKSEADFFVSFHLNIQKKSEVETNYETMGLYPVGGYGYKPIPGTTPQAYRYNPYRLPYDTTTTRVTTEVYEYEEGHLLVEIIYAKSNSVVWQGTVVDEISGLSTKEKKKVYINTIIEKLFKDFPYTNTGLK